MDSTAGDSLDWDALGEMVTAARVGRGLSKEEAARRAGVSSITWKRVEDGKRVQDAKLGLILRSLDLQLRVHIVDGTPRVFGGREGAVEPTWDFEPVPSLDPEAAASRLREIAEQNIVELRADVQREAAKLAASDPDRAARMLRDMSTIAVELRRSVEQAISEGIMSRLSDSVDVVAVEQLAADEDEVSIEDEQEHPETP